MNRRLLATLLVLFAAVGVALIPACRDKKSTDPPEPERTGAKAAFHHTRQILSFGPRPPGSAALKKTRDYITTELEKHGWTVTPVRFLKNVRYFGSEIRFTNLVARFGSSPDELVTGVLGAHIDSKYYRDRKFVGADDAASAVGTILEIARQLKSKPELARRLELVFFDGEEAFAQNISPSDGLYGSKHYALRWKAAPKKPAFGIVLDMIGHKDLKISYPSDTPPHLEQSLLRAARSIGEEARYSKALNLVLDDHVPLNNAGIPTIDVIGDFTQFAWWHTEADSLRVISRESLEITLQVVLKMLEEQLTNPIAE